MPIYKSINKNSTVTSYSLRRCKNDELSQYSSMQNWACALCWAFAPAPSHSWADLFALLILRSIFSLKFQTLCAPVLLAFSRSYFCGPVFLLHSCFPFALLFQFHTPSFLSHSWLPFTLLVSFHTPGFLSHS